MTGGGWRPGSGTIYPVLEDLKKDGLIQIVSRGRRSKQVYSLTEDGKRALEAHRETINEFAARWNRIRLAVMELLSPENLASLAIETQKTSRPALEKAIESRKIQKEELAFKLREYELLLESDLHWVREKLKGFH